jgi:ATP adenylyltransferase
MDRLWSPWRYAYVSQAQPANGCIFCEKAAQNRDAENYILHRGRLNFAILNLYPYTTGHMMVAPYGHWATLAEAEPEALNEMIQLTRAAEQHLQAVYRPSGFNIGMNIGACAGAGVAGHIHMHILPRWTGDSNFMSTVAETRVMPEDLGVTYRKLRERFQNGPD